VSTAYEGPSATVPGGAADNRPSVGDLISNVTQDLSTLMRQEVQLAKAELSQSASQAAKGGGMLAGAGYAGHMVLLFLSVAFWWGLGTHTGWGWSALVVAAVWLLIGAVLAVLGRGEMKRVKGAPQTARTVKQIPDAIKGNEEHV
jgi:hypothetical protein